MPTLQLSLIVEVGSIAHHKASSLTLDYHSASLISNCHFPHQKYRMLTLITSVEQQLH